MSLIASGIPACLLVLFQTSGSFAGETARPAPDVLGLWYDDSGRGAVEITQCGDKVCGHIVWLQTPLNRDGKPFSDRHNPVISRQSRPVCGLQVLGDLTVQSDGRLENGWVYDPKMGATFNVSINLVNQGQLHVRGYAKFKFLGKSLTWTQAPENLDRCTGPR